MSSHIQNFFINNQITHVFVHLVAYVFHGHDLTTPTSYFLIPACIFFLVTHLIKVPTNVLISSLTNSLFLDHVQFDESTFSLTTAPNFALMSLFLLSPIGLLLLFLLVTFPSKPQLCHHHWLSLFPYFFHVKDLSTMLYFFKARIKTMSMSGLPNLSVNLRPWWVWWSLQICGTGVLVIHILKLFTKFFVPLPFMCPPNCPSLFVIHVNVIRAIGSHLVLLPFKAMVR